MKLCTEVWSPKSKNAFVRGSKFDDSFPYFAPIVHPHNAFSMGMSKYRSNEVRGPIVAVKNSNDVAREWLQPTSTKLQNAVTPNVAPKTQKWGSTHIQWEYAWLSVLHIISQQRCEMKRWFQRTSYRKLHIRSPMVIWMMTSRESERSRSWPNIFEA